MVRAIEAARKAIESTYTGKCTVTVSREIKDKRTKITRTNVEVVVVKNQPCKLSFEKISAAVQTKTAALISQSTKLFISPKIKISPGSKIVVEQNGIKSEYCASGEPAVYPTHQEIMLELLERGAQNEQSS